MMRQKEPYALSVVRDEVGRLSSKSKSDFEGFVEKQTNLSGTLKKESADRRIEVVVEAVSISRGRTK